MSCWGCRHRDDCDLEPGEVVFNCPRGGYEEVESEETPE